MLGQKKKKLKKKGKTEILQWKRAEITWTKLAWAQSKFIPKKAKLIFLFVYLPMVTRQALKHRVYSCIDQIYQRSSNLPQTENLEVYTGSTYILNFNVEGLNW